VVKLTQQVGCPPVSSRRGKGNRNGYPWSIKLNYPSKWIGTLSRDG